MVCPPRTENCEPNGKNHYCCVPKIAAFHFSHYPRFPSSTPRPERRLRIFSRHFVHDHHAVPDNRLRQTFSSLLLSNHVPWSENEQLFILFAPGPCCTNATTHRAPMVSPQIVRALFPSPSLNNFANRSPADSSHLSRASPIAVGVNQQVLHQNILDHLVQCF